MYVSLSMTERLFEMLTDAVEDFIEIQSGCLREIGIKMKMKLESYRELINFKLVRVARILDPEFANNPNSDKLFLRQFMEESGYGILMHSTPTEPTSHGFLASVFGADEESFIVSNVNEISLFFQATLVKERSTIDPLIWWRANSHRFPTIGKFAEDIFVVQASSAAAESVFSIVGHVVDEKCSSLGDESITALMLFQSWMRYWRKNRLLIECPVDLAVPSEPLTTSVLVPVLIIRLHSIQT